MQNNSFINFYGRRSSFLSDNDKMLIRDYLPNYLISLEEVKEKVFLNSSTRFQEINLEIGFGYGDFLFESAKVRSNSFFLGVEVFQSGIVNLLRYLKKEELKNIKIYNDNIYYLFDYIEENTFDNIYILFPDPWGKKKHNKRRIINHKNLALFTTILKRGGRIRFVSDHYDYVRWSLQHFLSCKNFQWQVSTSDDFLNPPVDHIKTKYQRKAEEAGRKITYLDFINIK